MEFIIDDNFKDFVLHRVTFCCCGCRRHHPIPSRPSLKLPRYVQCWYFKFLNDFFGIRTRALSAPWRLPMFYNFFMFFFFYNLFGRQGDRSEYKQWVCCLFRNFQCTRQFLNFYFCAVQKIKNARNETRGSDVWKVLQVWSNDLQSIN